MKRVLCTTIIAMVFNLNAMERDIDMETQKRPSTASFYVVPSVARRPEHVRVSIRSRIVSSVEIHVGQLIGPRSLLITDHDTPQFEPALKTAMPCWNVEVALGLRKNQWCTEYGFVENDSDDDTFMQKIWLMLDRCDTASLSYYAPRMTQEHLGDLAFYYGSVVCRYPLSIKNLH
ncbi:hypothetical protein FACS189449_08910 [Alphaproteobacteria bacterium]|nr:hypothetical protein FACS189449_08910 [Alphaproteobacteria bacterium]